MADIFGKNFIISTFGESHGKGIGVVISGAPAGVKIQREDIQKELDRRRPGQSILTTQRKEADEVEILSGIFEGKTLGTAIAMLVWNKDAKSDSYEPFKDLFRPSHADFTYAAKYGIRDHRGGGRASARETIARVCAGAVAQVILNEYYDIQINSWVSQVYDICLDNKKQNWQRQQIESHPVRCPDPIKAREMEKKIKEIQSQGDSIGGIISSRISNVPAGLGSPVFDRFEADLGKAMLSIPATKGFEIGSGFSGVLKKGSEHNDIFIPQKKPRGEYQIGTKTNNSGGVQGGITNGEDVFFRVAFKPTATIFKEQETVNQKARKMLLKVKGRHDACVLPRAVPIVDAMAAMVTLDHILDQEKYFRFQPGISQERRKKSKKS